MDHSDLTNKGIVRGKEASLGYDPELNGGTLLINGFDWDEAISNQDVIAVVSDRVRTDTHHILLISRDSDEREDIKGSRYKLEDVTIVNAPQSFISVNTASPRIDSENWTLAHAHYVIISTGSGISEAQSFYDDVVKPAFAACGIHENMYVVHTTNSNESIVRFANTFLLPRANEGTPQTVLLLSGDGGVVDIVNVLLSAPRSERYVKPTLGLLAMGTGNALANSTGLNKDSTRGLRHFFLGEPRSLPTFTSTFSPGSELLFDEGSRSELLAPTDKSGVLYGAVVCSWALHASLVADSDTTELRKYGSQRFQMAAKELLMPSDGSEPHPYNGKVTLFKLDTHGEEIETTLKSHKYFYLLATMVSNLEEKLTISPHSQPLDGQLRLLHFGPIPTADVMKILGLAFQRGKHITDEAVSYDDIEGMRIDFQEEDPRWRRVCVDGKIVRVNEGGWVEVRKNSKQSTDVLDIIAHLGSGSQ